MKHVVTLTAFAACLALSGAAYAHGVQGHAGSGGSASSWANAPHGGVAAQETWVVTKNSSDRWGAQSFTKAYSTSVAAADHGPVSVGGSASAGGGASFSR